METFSHGLRPAKPYAAKGRSSRLRDGNKLAFFRFREISMWLKAGVPVCGMETIEFPQVLYWKFAWLKAGVPVCGMET